MAEVARATSIPVAADETVASIKDARRAAGNGECALATVKLAKVGGIGDANGIAAVLPIYLSSALDGPIGIAAAAHAAQALPFEGAAVGLAHGLATQLLFSETITSKQCEIAAGELRLSPGPGLGVEIDDEMLAKLRI
jgi:muconate cycloisomerase